MARSASVEIENIIGRVVATSMSDIVGTVGAAVIQFANSRTSKQFLAFLEQVSTGPGEARMAEAHRELAEGMQRSTIASWGQAKRRLRPAVYEPERPPRGPKNKYGRSSGGMDRALRDKDFVHFTARGVQFGDIRVLDADARQWARLNYGALPRGQGSNERFRVRFSNLPALEFDFSESARPGYGLPKGFFKDPGGRHQTALRGRAGPSGRAGAFYPRGGGGQQFPTQGNVGYHYLDSGIRWFFAELPRVYGEVFRDVLPSSARRGRPPIIAQTERVTSPRH